ncbi:MAG: prepilin-type N-terminal cleavage/methylation domain-containing protein, partial [Nevskiales bacterium]
MRRATKSIAGGFTLIELLAAIAIFAVMALMAYG